MTGVTSSLTILVIDDEPAIRRLLKTTLQAHGYEIIEAENGREGLVSASTRPPDMIILDMNLPDTNGLEVLEKLREWYDRPIMVLSVINSEENIVRALDLGADDYLTKPFGVPELLARLRVCIRHNRAATQPDPIFTTGPLSIDFSAHEVTLNGQIVKLTSTEFNLLKLFTKHAGKVLTHKFILKEIWGPGSGNDIQYLRVYIGHLRQKLEPNPDRPQLFITEPGVGYRLML